jgi:hypothetical protein
MKTLVASLAIAGAMILAQPAAQAASSVDGLKNTTVDLSAQTVRKTTVVKKKNGTTRRTTVVRNRTYAAPTYYGYYGPTYYERPYSRPATVTFGIGGWW